MFETSTLVPILSIPILFCIGIGCSSYPVFQPLNQRTKRRFGLANAFSGGVFLGAALLHLLPDAVESFETIKGIGSYPWANLISMVGFIATLGLELVLSPGHEALITADDVPIGADAVHVRSMVRNNDDENDGDDDEKGEDPNEQHQNLSPSPPLSLMKQPIISTKKTTIQQIPTLSSAVRQGGFHGRQGSTMMFRVDSPRLSHGVAQHYRVEDDLFSLNDDSGESVFHLSDMAAASEPPPAASASAYPVQKQKKHSNGLRWGFQRANDENQRAPLLGMLDTKPRKKSDIVEPVRRELTSVNSIINEGQKRDRAQTLQVLHSGGGALGTKQPLTSAIVKDDDYYHLRRKRQRQATLQPNQKIKIKYRSRMFESGFRSAMMIAKEMGYDLFDDCNVVFEAQLLEKGVQQGRKVRLATEDGRSLVMDEDQADVQSLFGSIFGGVSNDKNSDLNTLMNENQFSNNPSALSALIFLIILSIHSFITGMAVGSSDEGLYSQIIVASALFIHKASASLALGISVKKAHWTIAFSLKLLAGFAISTPIGVAVGLVLAEATKGQVHDVMVACFSAFSSGTFLYLSLMENIVEEFVESQTDLISKWWAVLTGALVMAVLAVFG